VIHFKNLQKLADESNTKVEQLKGELEGRSGEVETLRVQCETLGKQNKVRLLSSFGGERATPVVSLQVPCLTLV